VDCDLITHIKNESKVSIGGMCEVLLFDTAHHKEVARKLIIKPQTLGQGWRLLALDAEDGIAVYADEHVGAE
ncbi:MAG: hypothetical protein D6771_03570, partial [Zetaproteobacteria bacterium]